MARALKDLLSNDHPLFLMNVARLERASGQAGVDVRLIADVTERAHAVMRRLGLQPADTTSEELYRALASAVYNDDHDTLDLLRETPYTLLNLGLGPISFNLRDVIENAHLQLPYEKRIVSHAQRRLRAELVKRYAELERTNTRFVHEAAREIGLMQEHDDDIDLTEYIAMHLDSVQNQQEDTKDHPYMLAIGDIFTDAFIKLNDNEAKVTTDEDGKQWLSVAFGSKMPYDHVDIVASVGPSPNAAVSFSRLGLNAGLMAYLGDDEVGSESLAYLKTQSVDTSTIQPEAGAKSSYWYVLRYGADRTMLVKNEEYRYQWNEPEKEPDWIYLSQISQHAWGLHEELLAYLEEHPKVRLAFQPGTSHFRWGTEKLAAIYRRSHIVVMNREEAVDVTGASYDSVRDLANALHALGPHIVVITDGPHGSYASYDYKLVTIPNYPDPAPPFERTGAGDAFASTIVGALALGESMDTALTWAPINSAYVVQQLGAQKGLLRREQIDEYLRAAPEEYKVTKLED